MDAELLLRRPAGDAAFAVALPNLADEAGGRPVAARRGRPALEAGWPGPLAGGTVRAGREVRARAGMVSGKATFSGPRRDHASTRFRGADGRNDPDG